MTTSAPPQASTPLPAPAAVQARGQAASVSPAASPLFGPTRSALQESTLDPADALYTEVIPAGNGWSREILAGQIFRIVDLEGNQAVDTLFFNAGATDERYSAPDTMTAQRNIYLTTGSVLLSTEGRPLLTIVADTCGRHDTLGGACSAESNQVRYALEKKYMHSCRDTFLLELARLGRAWGSATCRATSTSS